MCVCVACPCAWTNQFLLVFFSCFHVCVVRIDLRDVSVVRETEWLLGRFFHALQTLRTANCTLFNIVLVEFFDIKSNNVNNNHTEPFTWDNNSYSQRLGNPSLKLTLLWRHLMFRRFPILFLGTVINNDIWWSTRFLLLLPENKTVRK